MSMTIFRNGEFVRERDAGVSPLDRGFLYGDGVFETLRCYDGRFFRLSQHLERMRAGLERLGIAAPAWLEEGAGILRELVARNAVTDGVARIVVTRGVGEFGLLGRQATEPLMLVACWNQPPPAAARYERGINCIIARQRLAATAGIKSLNYLPQVLARREAEAAGADDALMLDSHGHVAEATAANIFLVLRRELVTPSLEGEVLAGITRAAVLELAHRDGGGSCGGDVPDEQCGRDHAGDAFGGPLGERGRAGADDAGFDAGICGDGPARSEVRTGDAKSDEEAVQGRGRLLRG